MKQLRHVQFLAILLLAVSFFATGFSPAVESASTTDNPMEPPPEANVTVAELPPGKPMLPDSPLETAEGSGDIEYRWVDVADRPYSKALQIETKSQPDGMYKAGLRLPVTGEAAQGDVLLLSFDARTIRSEDESSLGSILVQTKLDSSQPKADLNQLINPTQEWMTVYLPFEAASGTGTDAKLGFFVGFKPQTVEIANVQLVNYEKTVTKDQLPRMRLTYPGMEQDAPWRTEADERIEQIRKAPVRIIVNDADGNPVEGASVEVKQLEHSFDFGGSFTASAVFGTNKNLTDEQKQKYKEVFANTFNKAVFPNELKWKHYDNLGASTVPQALEWLEEQRIPVRGHNLIWADWKRVPPELQEQLEHDPIKLRQVTNDHVKEYVERWRGRLAEWDVLNEPFSQHTFMDIAGKDIMIDWFQTARQADPEVKLYINDYGILAGKDFTHQDHYYETISYLLENGAPLDGIGMQGHFKSPTAPEDLLQRLDRFAKFGKEIQVTEFTFPSDDAEGQEQYVKDTLTALFSHSAVTGVMSWHFWEGINPESPLYKKDWSLTPFGKAWMDKIYGDWWTDQTGSTDEQGQYNTRAFLGKYEITVTKGEHRQVIRAPINKNGRTIKVKLK